MTAATANAISNAFVHSHNSFFSFFVLYEFGTIFQLSAAFLFGYQIAFRNKKAIRESTTVILRTFSNGREAPTKKTKSAYLETNIYLIGIIYLIIGYIIPLTNFEYELVGISDFAKIFIVIFMAAILVIVGDAVGKFITNINLKRY